MAEKNAQITRGELYKELSSINVEQYVEKKDTGKFAANYMSWVSAWVLLKDIDPDFTREYVEFDEYDFEAHKLTGRKLDYMQTANGAYVKCKVTIKGISATERLNVTNNKGLAPVKPNEQDVNNTKQRCFVKACALLGLGINVYAGEDLPIDVVQEKKMKKIENDKKRREESKLHEQARQEMVTAYTNLIKAVGKEIADTVFGAASKQAKVTNKNNISVAQYKEIENFINTKIMEMEDEQRRADKNKEIENFINTKIMEMEDEQRRADENKEEEVIANA